MTLAFDLPAGVSSPLHRLDPRWKLAGLLSAAVACSLLRTPAAALTAAAASFGLVLLARLPLAWIVQRLGIALLMLALFVCWRPLLLRAGEPAVAFGWLTLSLPGLEQTALLLARAASLVTLMLVLLATAPLHDTMKAAHSLRIPGVLLQLAMLTYRYVFLLAEEFGRLRTALRVRGFRSRADRRSYRTIGQVAGTLLVRSHEQAERVAQAMRCRGFDGRFRSLHDFQTRWVDVLAFGLLVGVAAGLMWWDRARSL